MTGIWLSGCFGFIRATGIEPVSHAWEARVLPLNDARVSVSGAILYGDMTDVKVKSRVLYLIVCRKVLQCVNDVAIIDFRRGYSLVVKLQPSKLIMRVRFPLPA